VRPASGRHAPDENLLLFAVILATRFAWSDRAFAAEGNLYTGGKIVLVAPDHPDPLEDFALAELAKHVERATGQAPETTARRCQGRQPDSHRPLGSNRSLGRLAEESFFK